MKYRTLEKPGIHEDLCSRIEGNAMPRSDRSGKYNDRGDKIHKELRHTFKDGEDDMIESGGKIITLI